MALGLQIHGGKVHVPNRVMRTLLFVALAAPLCLAWSVLVLLFPQATLSLADTGRGPLPGRVVPAQRSEKAAAVPAEYAGSEACALCHEKARAAAATLPYHLRLETDSHLGWTGRGCEACHGPGKAHAESGGQDSVISFKTAGARGTQACLTCHSGDRSHAAWPGSPHENAGVNCVACHSAHSPKQERHLMARRTQAEICYSCHANVRKANLQRSTHLFRDVSGTARIECSSCHNVHGTQTEKLIAANSVNEKCFTCHAEKRGPFLWEHAPARENCLNCHTPHGSNNRALLVMRTTQLCQSCHIQGRHQTVVGRPNTVFNFNRACLNCHSMVHGTNHPSGVILQR